MITELEKKDFYKCRSLLNEQGQLEVKAVIEGVNPGRIFVDNTETPDAGLVWLGNNDGFIFIGNEENEGFHTSLNDFMDQVIILEAKKVGLDWFEAIGNHHKWYKKIESLFEHRKLASWNQKVYTLYKENYTSKDEPVMEQGYEVHTISEELYANREQSIANIDFLHHKVLEFWSTPESFFNEGIGYCIVYDNMIVSVCFSGFVVGNTHCIDIETLEDHRGKKLAQKIAHRFAQECVERDKVAYWDCMEENKPSVAVAESIGFANSYNYVGYYFSFE